MLEEFLELFAAYASRGKDAFKRSDGKVSTVHWYRDRVCKIVVLKNVMASRDPI